MNIDTKELLHRLTTSNDIKGFIDNNENEFINIKYTDFLNSVLAQKDISIASVAKKSGQGDYVYKVLNGERKPSRDVLISIAFGMQLSLDETQLLLRISKNAMLDPRDKRDSIIIYAINEQFPADKLNELLFEMKFSTL